jgi:hypothetical protein
VKLNSLKIPAAKTPPAPAKTNTAPQTPVATSTKKPAEATRAKQSSLAEQERRRTQRVLLRIRASIHVAVQGQATTFEVATLSVNPHGAVVVMNHNLPADTRLVLEHSSTGRRVACKVARPAREMPEGFHVPIEFDSPAPGFWQIDFPPTDWRPES